MYYIEAFFRYNGLCIVAFVITIGHQAYGSLCHCCKISLHQRRDSYNCGCIVKYSLLKFMVLSFSPLTQHQMLEIEYFCPWIPEIRHPWNACGKGNTACDKVHRLRRPSADDDVYGMLLQVFLPRYPGLIIR